MSDYVLVFLEVRWEQRKWQQQSCHQLPAPSTVLSPRNNVGIEDIGGYLGGLLIYFTVVKVLCTSSREYHLLILTSEKLNLFEISKFSLSNLY